MILSSLEKFKSMILGPGGPLHEVTVYSRQGCTCCEKAMAELHNAARKYKLHISLIDIDNDPKLVEAYGQEVPVIAIGGKVRFKGKINPILLERLLKQAGAAEE